MQADPPANVSTSQSSCSLPLDFRLLFESAPALYLVLTPDFRILAVSDAYLRATMTKRDEMLGRGIFDVFPDNPDDPTATGVRNLRASLERVLREQVSDSMAVQKYDIRRPESAGGGFEARYWSPVNSPVFGTDDRIAYIIHRVDDVTEFVRLREKGIEQEKVTQKLLSRGEEMEAEIFLRAQEIQDANQRLRKANEDLSRLHAELEQRVQERTMQLARANAELQSENRERQRTAETLRVSEERLRLMIEGVKDYAIFMLDLAGNMVSWNTGAERILGYRAEEVVGRSYSLFFPAEDVANGSYQMELDQAAAEGRFDYTGWRVRKDGSRFWANSVLTALYDEHGQVRGFAKITRDLTEQHRLEAQLHQSQKMEAFGQLAGGVAHDFNNLLTIIGGYSEMLISQFPQGDPRSDMLQQIHRAGERAASLTRQLLAFSRQQVLASKVLVLNGVVSDTEKMLRRLIGEDVQFVAVLAPGLSPVKVDPGQIEQVIMNLVVNARDAMPQGGKLTIETQNVELGEGYAKTHLEVKPGHYVLLAISDTGTGMAPEVKARIFEPFYTTKGVGKGTGLGLAVVQGIVKQSGGNIEVYSEVGIGTTFKIYFPAVRERATSLSSHGLAKPALGTETILLVEDEAAVRELAALSLQGFGYTVLKASNGKDALRLLESRSERIDLLVSDVVMPEMGGGKLAEVLRERYPNLKVMFVSGYTDDAVFRHGVLQSEVAFLQKPFTAVALARKVRDVLDQKK